MKYFASQKLYPAVSELSTNYGTQLDCAFTKGLNSTFTFNESYFSDHKPLLISLKLCAEFHFPDTFSNLIESRSIPTDGTDSNSKFPIHSNVIIGKLIIPSPTIPTITIPGNISHTFTYPMRRALADSINLHHIPIRSTDFSGARITSTSYYNRMHTNLRSRFNLD